MTVLTMDHVQKAPLQTDALQTLHEFHASPNGAKRLECGAFTAAFWGDGESGRIVLISRKLVPHAGVTLR